jgi:RNA polymerase sigma-70 factor (ECF subfamily)
MNTDPQKPLPPDNGVPLNHNGNGDVPGHPGHIGNSNGIVPGRHDQSGHDTRVREEFEILYQRHSREVWALAYARWMNADTAMDIMQETFLRLWKQWEKREEIINPRAWLLRVARNLAEDHAKSAFRRNGTTPPQAMNSVQANGKMPLDSLEQEETFGQLRKGLEQLAPDDREILTLRYALDYDTEVIAERLSINPSAVHMRLSRARQRLAERLKAQGIEQNR